MRVLTCLCASECDPEIRIQSAEILSSLLLQNTQLQNAAFYSNQLPKKIEKYFQLPTGKWQIDWLIINLAQKFPKFYYFNFENWKYKVLKN